MNLVLYSQAYYKHPAAQDAYRYSCILCLGSVIYFYSVIFLGYFMLCYVLRCCYLIGVSFAASVIWRSCQELSGLKFRVIHKVSAAKEL